MKRKTKILLVDDHTLFRSGLKFLLEKQEDFSIVGEAADGLEAIKLIKQVKPDLVLLDVDMPIMNGKETLMQIREMDLDLLVLMLTVSEDAEDLTTCIQMGANGYLLKTIDIDFLLDSIKKVLTGESILSPRMTDILMKSLSTPKNIPNEAELTSLTAREYETLIKISEGKSNKVIAKELDLSESTVKVYVQNILRKLNLKSRVQAAVYVIEKNLS